MAAHDSTAVSAAVLAPPDSALGRLPASYGESLGPRRLATDVRRLPDDMARLGDPVPGHQPAGDHNFEENPKVLCDRSLWTDAVAEGSGATDRRTR
jgi:hypothetical protein